MSISRTSRPRGKGVQGEPAYVLHRYEWSESSLIIELFTRNLGRVAVAAKGVRRPTSSFRTILLPFQPLLVGLGPEAEIRRLRGVEWAGGYAMPTGEPLIVGYYVNELLMRLLARDEPQPLVFDAYAQTLAVIAKQPKEEFTQPMLRSFELILLQVLGVLPALNFETLTQKPLSNQGVLYTLDPEVGLLQQKKEELNTQRVSQRRVYLLDNVWYAIQKALDSDSILEELPLVVAPVANELKYILRALLNHHAGANAFHTRKLMQALQKTKSV